MDFLFLFFAVCCFLFSAVVTYFLVTRPGHLSAVICPALVRPEGGGPAEEAAGSAAGLAEAAGEEEEGGEGGGAERTTPALDEPAEEGRLQSAVPLPGEYGGDGRGVEGCMLLFCCM